MVRDTMKIRESTFLSQRLICQKSIEWERYLSIIPLDGPFWVISLFNVIYDEFVVFLLYFRLIIWFYAFLGILINFCIFIIFFNFLHFFNLLYILYIFNDLCTNNCDLRFCILIFFYILYVCIITIISYITHKHEVNPTLSL